MSSSAPRSSPVPTEPGRRGANTPDTAVRLARAGVRALILAAIVSAIGAVLVAVLVVVGGLMAAAVVLVVVALLLVALAGSIGGALRAHGAAAGAVGARPSGSTTPVDPENVDRTPPVTDDEIEAARAMFRTGDGPVDFDPSWR